MIKLPLPHHRPRAKHKANPYMAPIMLVAGIVLVLQMMWVSDNDYLFAPFSIEKIKCEECDGLGLIRDSREQDAFILCPACFGVGSHYVRRADSDDKLCPACIGMGRLREEDGTWRNCGRCDGRGLIRKKPWIVRGEDLPKVVTNLMLEKSGSVKELP